MRVDELPDHKYCGHIILNTNDDNEIMLAMSNLGYLDAYGKKK